MGICIYLLTIIKCKFIKNLSNIVRRPSLQYPPFCDEKRKESTKLGLLLE